MTKSLYSTALWRRTRLEVLARDGYLCQIGRPGCLIQATEADHIVPAALGGAFFDPRNLRAACKPCNAGRYQAELKGLASAAQEGRGRGRLPNRGESGRGQDGRGSREPAPNPPDGNGELDEDRKPGTPSRNWRG